MKDKFHIYVNGQKDVLYMEDYLQKHGYKWRTDEQYRIREGLLNPEDVLILSVGCNIPYAITYADDDFINDGGVVVYENLIKDFKIFKYPEDKIQLDAFINGIPTYEPRKLIRE